MKFPWNKYEELSLERRNTLQIFITNKCNLNCKGCFARRAMKDNPGDISLEEYKNAVFNFLKKGGKQINILGGEPLLHPQLRKILDFNRENKIKTTVYTNGYFLKNFSKEDFIDIKLRISLCSQEMMNKEIKKLPITDIPIDANFMISKKTTLNELLDCANYVEKNYNCKVFFIFSMREMDNKDQEFFDDTKNTMSVIDYKKLVHRFLEEYNGNMKIHISKRGVFESTKTLPDTKCRFANYFVGGKIIQCPYDVVNLKFQKDYEFNCRDCQQNNTCLMSKIILKRK
ncbi:MAG: radical SAM protein [Candidatus Pacearchaeota archaeon]|jgi:organic radical activating enzyme